MSLQQVLVIFSIAAIGLCLPHQAIADAGTVDIVSREDWRGAPPGEDMTAMELPVSRVVIAHTAGASCQSDQSCASQVLGLQYYQTQMRGFADISYHFLIGDTGRVYEGRQLTKQGALAMGANADTMSIVFMGNYDLQEPTEQAIAAAQALIAQTVASGKLRADYQLLGHRDLSATSSPGDALYKLIKKWPHWKKSS